MFELQREVDSGRRSIVGDNIPILDAVKQHVTLGEICDLFRSQLDEYRDPAYL